MTLTMAKLGQPLLLSRLRLQRVQLEQLPLLQYVSYFERCYHA